MRHWLPLIFGLALIQSAMAQDLRDTLFAETDLALEAARNANASLLSPRLFADGLEAYAAAESDLERGRNLDRIRNRLNTAITAFTNSAEASEIAEITLASLIKTRDDAIQALADNFAAELWADAEEMFDSTARRLESGNIRGARTRADEAEALFRDAELTAIKAQYLSQTRALLAQAEQALVAAPFECEHQFLALTVRAQRRIPAGVHAGRLSPGSLSPRQRRGDRHRSPASRHRRRRPRSRYPAGLPVR